MITPLLIGAAALLILGKRKQTVEGIGRIKRRVYVEIEAAQKAGVPLHEKYINLSSGDIDALREIGERFGWKQTRRSIESGKAYSEAYFNSLKRAYNAITGVQGIGTTHKVRNANGDVVLEWRDIEAAAAHVAQERDLAELEARLAKQRRSIRNTRQGYNLAPTPSTYQDQQLYEQSNFPDNPQQLALFGVGSVNDVEIYRVVTRGEKGTIRQIYLCGSPQKAIGLRNEMIYKAGIDGYKVKQSRSYEDRVVLYKGKDCVIISIFEPGDYDLAQYLREKSLEDFDLNESDFLRIY